MLGGVFNFPGNWNSKFLIDLFLNMETSFLQEYIPDNFCNGYDNFILQKKLKKCCKIPRIKRNHFWATVLLAAVMNPLFS